VLVTPTSRDAVLSDIEQRSLVERKFEPWLWNEIQTLKSNGTVRDLSLVIRLGGYEKITAIQDEDLRGYAADLFSSRHNAIVYSVLRALPIIIAKVPAR